MIDIEHLARRALEQFDVAAGHLEFIRHSQAQVFCVRGKGCDKFALRLHKPISQHLGGELLDAAVIRSEMMWVNHLFRNTGIPVQEPMRTRTGDWLALVAGDGGVVTPVNCTLHRWIEGGIGDEAPLTEERVRGAAALLANLHNAAASWQPPDEFRRPRYDALRLRRALDAAAPTVGLGVISHEDFQTFELCMDRIEPFFVALDNDSAHWGLIHGDYWMANVVFRSDGSAAPIDFSECGWGAYAQDVGAMLLKIGRFRAAFLDEYQHGRELPPQPVRVCEAFIIANFIAWMAFLSSVPERHERLTQWIPGIAHYFCGPFLRGESFLMDESTFTVKPKPEGAEK